VRSSYTVFRNDRADSYGGVLIGVRSNLESQLLYIDSTLEICTVSVYLTGNKHVIVICIYRAPNTDLEYFNDLCSLITVTSRKYPNASIYRLQLTHWSSESITTYRYPFSINQRALDMTHDCGFAQTVNFPTRNDNILDLFFTNRPTLVQKCYSDPGISNHEIVMVTLEPQSFYNSINSYKIYLWNKANFSELKENMCNFAAEFCGHSSVEILWMHLRDKLLFLLDRFVPSKLKNNNRQPWIKKNIRQLR